MSKSVFVYAGLLVLSLGGAWMRYTGDEEVAKDGVIVVDGKSTDLAKVVYTSPDLTVTLEYRTDAFGRYGWSRVEDSKKKGTDEAPVEPKITEFKTGSAAEKVADAFAPMYALRQLEAVDDAQLVSFGLKESDSTVEVTSGGRTVVFELGGETYGTKDRYARNKADGKVYVLDDEPFKTLKFASTRLPERGVLAAKVETIEGVSLGVGAETGSWTQKNKDDKAAAYWEREGATSKDESFGNWIEKALKLKSTGYVQAGEEPAETTPAFDLTVRAAGSPPETLHLLQAGEDWYASSDSTRGMVKLSRGAAKDVAEDAQDVAEGKAIAPKPDAPEGEAAAPTGAGGRPPPGMRPPMPGAHP